jgi:hypothetical protein
MYERASVQTLLEKAKNSTKEIINNASHKWRVTYCGLKHNLTTIGFKFCKYPKSTALRGCLAFFSERGFFAWCRR